MHQSALVLPMIVSLALAMTVGASAEDGGALTTRFCSYNIEDLRAREIGKATDVQANAAIAVIGHLRPDVLLINELQYDGPMDAEGPVREGTAAHVFAKRIAEAHADLVYQVMVAPVNTGVPSGLDLDHNGKVGELTHTRDYANDCLGFGNFPGQYGMALLVREGITIDWDNVRTFRTFKWVDMPGAKLPVDHDEQPWYDEAVLAKMPLSSKSHWDVPLVLADGARVHVLASHSTPPVFDGPEDRNGMRNHDEIRFWAEYLNSAEWLIDDAGVVGGLDANEMFVIMGDLNADPKRGDSLDNPIGRFLLSHPRVNGRFTPKSVSVPSGKRDDVTSSFRLRVDYVLPSDGIEVPAGHVYRGAGDSPLLHGAAVSDAVLEKASDHFPVWAELSIPPPAADEPAPAEGD